MPFAIDRREKMFTAANLNNLYSRFDAKSDRVLAGKSPLFASSRHGTWQGKYPYGVWYVYRNDPDTCKRLRDDGVVPAASIPGIGSLWQADHTEVAAQIALSQLEAKHLDPVGRQVYLDHWSVTGDPFEADIAAAHFSFELHTRDVNGEPWDVHLGWDPPATSGLTSYVRGSLGPFTPTLPPGRIHKHRLAIAEIALEGIGQFRILRTYQRFDCWRVHNCGSETAEVLLQLPDGSADRQYVGPGDCRAFRRRPDGTWATTWPGTNTFCRYFFPYFTGDIPFFAEGPPSWGVNGLTGSPFLALERSAQANNVANPWVLLEWMNEMEAVPDPFNPYDIRQVYSGVYADPANANTLIGDAVFTWGRAKVVTPSASGDLVTFRTFSATNTLVQQLQALGIQVTVNATSLTLSSPVARIIYPVDANIFTTANTPYWEITSTPTNFSTVYPSRYTTETAGGSSTWTAGNEPTIFDSMRTLRRKIAVEVGFLNNWDDVPDIVEEKVSIVTLTPTGLVCRAATAYGVGGSTLINFESTATTSTLWIADRPVNFGVGSWQNFRHTTGTLFFHLQVPRLGAQPPWDNVFPARRGADAAIADSQAINTAFVPPGGPWGFSSSVYDLETARVYEINPITSTSDVPWGADFWQNKWGGRDGIDASVRIPGSPNRTQQYAYVPDPNNGSFVELVGAGVDDIFKDRDQAAMASTVPLPGVAAPAAFDGLTEIRWTGYTEANNFSLQYSPVENWTLPGGGPFFHKIPKTAWLWNLLEAAVRGWTRAVPLCLGQDVCPMLSADSASTILVSTILGSTGNETVAAATGPAYYLDESEYEICLANGIVAYAAQDALGNDIWFVPAVNLAAYCDSQGFTFWNFDTQNGRPSENPPVAATAIRALRNYGPGERIQSATYFDATVNEYKYQFLRYADLRLPNELAS
jgi:hypothetical protein